MVTGRVEVREEVERTGCSEAARGGGGGGGRCFETLIAASSSHSKTASGVFCAPPPLSVAPRRLNGLLFARLSAQVVEYTGAADVYVTACSQT